MNIKVKKLHLNTKLLKNLTGVGMVRDFFYKKQLDYLIKKHGLKQHSVNSRNGQLEVVVEGEKSKLWEIVKSAKKPSFFYKIEQITFQFTEVN